MNNFKKIALSILGGIDTTIYLATPLMLVLLWINLLQTSIQAMNYFYFIIGISATIFRAIKIGWLK